MKTKLKNLKTLKLKTSNFLKKNIQILKTSFRKTDKLSKIQNYATRKLQKKRCRQVKMINND